METRKILVEFEFDPKYWESENDICDELIMEDLLHCYICNHHVGVSYKTKTFSEIFKEADKKIKQNNQIFYEKNCN